MATSKPNSKQNLSDLLRQEAKQDTFGTKSIPVTKTKTEIPEQAAVLEFSHMTKAQLLDHINTLYSQKSEPVTVPDTSALATQNQALADQVKALEKKIADQEQAIAKATQDQELAAQVKLLEKKIVDQEQAIAKAETTIKTLKTDSAEKAKLEKKLGEQQNLVEKLHEQIQTLEAQKVAQQTRERTVDEDRALVLARISSYQVNLQFPKQPSPSISEADIGWFD